MKNKLRKRLVIFVVAISMLLISCKSTNTESNNRIKYDKGNSYTIKKGEVSEYILAKGIVQSKDEMIVTHSSIASIDDVSVKKGDYVKEGDLLFTYNKSDIETRISELNNEYEKLKLSKQYTHSKNEKNYKEALSEMEKKTINAQKDIDEATADYDKITKEYNDVLAELSSIEKEVNNFKNDPDKLLIYEERYSQKLTEVKEIEQSVTQCKKTIEEAKSQYNAIAYEAQKNVDTMLEVIDEEKQSTELTDLEIQIADKKSILKNVEVYAPISGIITAVYVEQGMTQIDERTVTIRNCNVITAVLEVNEEDIQDVENNMSVDVYIGNKSNTVTGTVERISHINSDASSTYSVEVDIENNNVEKIFFGMSVTAKIYTEVKNNAISVPYECINIGEDEEVYVMRINKDSSSTEKIIVETGIEGVDYIEIISDSIKDGDRLVIN